MSDHEIYSLLRIAIADLQLFDAGIIDPSKEPIQQVIETLCEVLNRVERKDKNDAIQK